jgi:predicted TIM-barrel fold metal-dependent hydrolase
MHTFVEARIRLEGQFKINDSHVHIGTIKSIYSHLETGDVEEFRTKNNIHMILALGSDYAPELSNQMVEFLAENVPYVYGLHWYKHNAKQNLRITPKMLGVKFHGVYNDMPVTKMNPDLLEGLDKNKAVLLVHCGRYKDGSRESNSSYLHAIDVGRNYRNIKVILAHMGGTDTTICKEAINDAMHYDNIYFDTSGITTPYIIEYALHKIPSKRILFGSDTPWCSFNSQLYNVIDADISLNDKLMILYKSFVECLGETSWLLQRSIE